MRPHLLLGTLSALAILISGCSQDSRAPFEPGPEASALAASVSLAEVGTAGGLLETDRGRLEVPVSALHVLGELSLETSVVDGFTHCTIGPEPLSFGVPAQLSLLLPSASQPGAGPYVVERWDEAVGAWEPVGGQPAGMWIEVGVVVSGRYRALAEHVLN